MCSLAINAELPEEAMNPATMAETAERMRTMKPGDIDGLLSEMATMSPVQKEQLKSMGMDPAMVRLQVHEVWSCPR